MRTQQCIPRALCSLLAVAVLATTQTMHEQIKRLHPNYDLTGKMKSYLATITDVDTQIGRILAKLEELNLSRHTLVVFSSDNGAVINNMQSVPSHDMWPANAGP